jgi:nitroreductase
VDASATPALVAPSVSDGGGHDSIAHEQQTSVWRWAGARRAEGVVMVAEKVVWNQVKVPETNMSVYEALHKRRMAWSFQDKPVPREAVERMMNTAVWAPNHRLNEPWRFLVLEKDSPVRQEVAETIYQSLVKEWDSERRAAPYKDKVLDPPIVIYSYYVDNEDWFVAKENYAAVIAAMQNISLAGAAEGLAVTWDTGRVTRVPEIDQLMGAEENWKVLAMLSVGYPAEESQSSRTPANEFTRWL